MRGEVRWHAKRYSQPLGAPNSYTGRNHAGAGSVRSASMLPAPAVARGRLPAGSARGAACVMGASPPVRKRTNAQDRAKHGASTVDMNGETIAHPGRRGRRARPPPRHACSARDPPLRDRKAGCRTRCSPRAHSPHGSSRQPRGRRQAGCVGRRSCHHPPCRPTPRPTSAYRVSPAGYSLGGCIACMLRRITASVSRMGAAGLNWISSQSSRASGACPGAM